MTPASTLQPLRAALAAVAFLTRVPSPAWVGHSPELLARSTTYFPLVGALVGAWGAACLVIASLLWSPWIAATLATAATVWLTGALHEDALADACDGLGGGRSKADILRIMKDNRVGAFGVLGLTLALGLKIGALATMPAAEAARALVAGHVLARWSSLPLLHVLPYARDDGGTGKPFAAGVTRRRLVVGTLLAIGLVAAAVGISASRPIPIAGLPPIATELVVALGTFALALVVTLLAGRFFHRRIGGITGDCLGAANQAVELAVYLTLSAAWS